MNHFRSLANRYLLSTRFAVFIVVLLPLVVYLLTLQNGLTPGELQGGDAITHQYAQATLRFANAPGYPIFTMLGWLWFQLSAFVTPFFNPIERLAFYSTLYAIPSLVLLYFLLLKVQQPSSLSPSSGPLPLTPLAPSVLAVLATLFFAFTYFFWYYAISPENYSSSVLLTLVIVTLAWRWQEQRDERSLLWLCFACGLSLAHLVTVALAVPAVILFVLGQQLDYLRRPKLIGKVLLVTALPLLSYAYIYWRGAEHPEWRGQGNWPTTWAWFVDFLKTQQGQGELTWSWDGIPWSVLNLIGNELTWLVFIGGLVGLALLPRWRALLLLGIVAVYAPAIYIDRNGNWFQAIIPLYALLVIGFVVLLNRTYVLVARDLSTPIASVAIALLLIVLALSRLVGNFAVADLRDRPAATGLEPGWRLLDDEPALAARIVGSYEEGLALDYLTQVWHARPDVRTLAIGQLKAQSGQPLYASRVVMPLVMKALSPDVRLSSQGAALIVLRDTPMRDVPSTARSASAPIVHGLQLAAFATKRDSAQQQVTLYWRAAQPVDVNMSISVRLMQNAQIIAQADGAHPVDGFYPMTRWLAGEVVRDDYVLSATDIADRIHIIAYRATASGFENLAEYN